MKIAVNTRFLLPDRLEGIGRVSHELLKRMVANHPEDEFIFFFDRPWDQQYIYAPNVRPYAIFPQARHPFLWYWWFEWSIPKALKREQVDVFFSPDNYLSLKTKTPTVMICHDLAHIHYPDQIPGLVRRYYDYYVPRFLKKATRIMAVSAYTRNDIIDQYQIEPSKVQTIPNACSANFKVISHQEIQEVRKTYAEGQPYFLYIGAVHPRKNVDRMIQAFDRFKQKTGSPFRLLIGGRLAWQIESVQEAFEQAKHKEAIQFLDRIPEEELPKLMGAAFSLVYVSLFEGFGLPVLESLNCGVPVICSNSSSLPEVAGKAGLLVNPMSVEEISEAMVSMVNNSTIRESCISNIEKQVQQFSWDDSAERLYLLLKEAAHSKA